MTASSYVAVRAAADAVPVPVHRDPTFQELQFLLDYSRYALIPFRPGSHLLDSSRIPYFVTSPFKYEYSDDNPERRIPLPPSQVRDRCIRRDGHLAEHDHTLVPQIHDDRRPYLAWIPLAPDSTPQWCFGCNYQPPMSPVSAPSAPYDFAFAQFTRDWFEPATRSGQNIDFCARRVQGSFVQALRCLRDSAVDRARELARRHEASLCCAPLILESIACARLCMVMLDRWGLTLRQATELVAQLQRSILECRGFCLYCEDWERAQRGDPPTNPSNCYPRRLRGALTGDLKVAFELHSARVPVWLISERPACPLQTSLRVDPLPLPARLTTRCWPSEYSANDDHSSRLDVLALLPTLPEEGVFGRAGPWQHAFGGTGEWPKGASSSLCSVWLGGYNAMEDAKERRL